MNHNAKRNGIIAGAATGAHLVGSTAALTGSAANLGGYITAQTVASSLGLTAGPALSVGIAAIGGPVVAGALAVAGVGAGVALLSSLFD